MLTVSPPTPSPDAHGRNVITKEQADSLHHLAHLVRHGGPAPEDDAALTNLLGKVWSGWRTGAAVPAFVQQFRALIPANPESAQGFAFLKPNGYPGCFETIDRVYRYHAATAPHLANWDRYFHLQPATQAVRNRKEYFKNWLRSRVGHTRVWCLLNLACGPCRDVSEYLTSVPPDLGEVHCIDQDQRALAYAAALCKPLRRRVTFERANVLRYRGAGQYDLVWSAGLFDYLPDGLFVRLLSGVRGWLRPGGEAVVGNFAASNPTIPYMEVVLDWHLHHRSADHLRALAVAAGFAEQAISIGREPLGINLFLHLRAHP
jgi:extracellular factor (EF) 3-hydroxypalmitic acid methyl ester biosynthesis protein